MKPQKSNLCSPCQGIFVTNFKTLPEQKLDDCYLGHESTFKGYTVRVFYNKISEEEMRIKRALIARIIVDAWRKREHNLFISNQGATPKIKMGSAFYPG